LLIARGSDNAGTEVFYASLGAPATQAVAAGSSGDILISRNSQIRYLPGDGASLVVPTGSNPGVVSSMAVMGVADRRLLAVVGTTLCTSGDYRAAQPTATGLGGITSVAASGGRAWALTASGICEILDPFGAPSLAPPSYASATLQRLTAANQSSVALAALSGTGVNWTDGVTSAFVTYPAGVALSNIGSLSVIVRT